MSSDDRLSNLMFLLALTPMTAGCPGDDSSPSNTTTTTAGSSSTGPSVVSTSSTGPEPGSTSTGPEPGTTVVLDTTADSGTTTDEPTGSTTGELLCKGRPAPIVGEIDPLCPDYASAVNQCFYDGELSMQCIEYYEIYCQYLLEDAVEYGGDDCGTAYAEYLSCLSALPCEELTDDDENDCPDEFMAAETACQPQ